MYAMIVTDIIGAIGCYAARHRLGHRPWFVIFLWLCALLWIGSRVAAILSGQVWTMVDFFPPTLGSMWIFPLLLSEKLFPSLPMEHVETTADNPHTAWPVDP